MKKIKWLITALQFVFVLIVLLNIVMRPLVITEETAQKFYHGHEQQLVELEELVRTPELKKYRIVGDYYMIPKLGLVKANYMENPGISFITVYVFAGLVLFTDPGGVEDSTHTYIGGNWYANVRRD